MYQTRSAVRSSRIAFGALLLRDLVVLRKHLREFIPRTIVQPLLLCFVFLYVFPTIGTGVGGRGGAAGESAFATTLVAGGGGMNILVLGIPGGGGPLGRGVGDTEGDAGRGVGAPPGGLGAAGEGGV